MTDNPFIDAFNAGRQAHRQNEFSQAIDHYKQALAIDGENAPALSLYGIALVQAGRVTEAEAPLKKAIAKGFKQAWIQGQPRRVLSRYRAN